MGGEMGRSGQCAVLSSVTWLFPTMDTMERLNLRVRIGQLSSMRSGTGLAGSETVLSFASLEMSFAANVPPRDSACSCGGGSPSHGQKKSCSSSWWSWCWSMTLHGWAKSRFATRPFSALSLRLREMGDGSTGESVDVVGLFALV